MYWFSATGYNKHTPSRREGLSATVSLLQTQTFQVTNYSAALLTQNLVQETGESFTRWCHLGPGWQDLMYSLASTADPCEYNRWDGADSADVSEENKDISSLVHPVKASIYLATVCQITALDISVKLADYMSCQVQQVLRAIGVNRRWLKEVHRHFSQSNHQLCGCVCIYIYAVIWHIEAIPSSYIREGAHRCHLSRSSNT